MFKKLTWVTRLRILRDRFRTSEQERKSYLFLYAFQRD